MKKLVYKIDYPVENLFIGNSRRTVTIEGRVYKEERKEKLKAVINSSIKAFELETGVTIDGVYLGREVYVPNNVSLSTTEKACPLLEVRVRIEM